MKIPIEELLGRGKKEIDLFKIKNTEELKNDLEQTFKQEILWGNL